MQLPPSLVAQQSKGKRRPLETDGNVGTSETSEVNGSGPVPMQLDNENLPQFTGGHAYPSAPGLLLTVNQYKESFQVKLTLSKNYIGVALSEDNAVEGQVSANTIQRLVENLPPSRAQYVLIYLYII